MCSSWYNNWVTRQYARCNNENKKLLCFFANYIAACGVLHSVLTLKPSFWSYCSSNGLLIFCLSIYVWNVYQTEWLLWSIFLCSAVLSLSVTSGMVRTVTNVFHLYAWFCLWPVNWNEVPLVLKATWLNSQLFFSKHLGIGLTLLHDWN